MSATVSTYHQPETGVKAFVRRRPLLSMYALMFLLAWPALIADALASRSLIPRLPAALSFFTGWAPAISAIVITSLLAGSQGVRALLRRFITWRLNPLWYVTGLLLMAGLILAGIGLDGLFGGNLPVIPAANAPAVNVAVSFVVMLILGIVFNTEEIAWRGFALPRLQTRYGVLAACGLLAIPEVLLHLPYFWNQDISFYQTVGVFWFSAFSIAAVFIYAFIFNKTRGSLLIVSILHASQNAWANLLSDNSVRPFIFTVAVMWMIALALILVTKGQLGYQTTQSVKEQ